MGRKVDPKMLLLLYIVLLPLINTQMGQTGFTLGCLKPEREALFKFKASVSYDDANLLFSWKGDDCCSWCGVTCHNSTRHVLRLDLRFDYYAAHFSHGYDTPWYPSLSPFYNFGFDVPWFVSASRLSFSELNPSLLELRQLRYLDLSGNSFNNSPIPEWIGSMKHLRYLYLSNGVFDGGIPPQLGNLTRLRALDLSGNFFPHSVPHILSNMTSLKFLDLSNNQLNGSIPLWLMSMRGLEFLSLSHNSFSYPLFSHSALPSTIQYLDFSNNNLKGPLPLFLSNMTSLKSLDLSFNQLNGSIPLWLGNMKGLEHLYLAANNFSQAEGGTIMGILGNLCHLKSLNLQNSRVGGNFLGLNHENYSNCVEYDLEYLDLTFNNITDTLPYWLGDWLGEFRKLNTLKLGSNRLYGPIPPSIGNLSSLIELDLSSCNLWGTIPTSLGSLSSLETLDLSNNYLEGSIPTSLGSLPSLETLVLSNNYLEGSIPTSPGSLPSLETLVLSNNYLEGPIPTSLGSLSSLETLVLSNNYLEGSIPTSLGSLPSLETLYLSSNMLQGVVSDSHLANLSSLKFLDLSNNNALKINLNWNKIPTFQLVNLDMRSCKIEHQFPQWLTMQNELRELDLSNTGLFGEIIDWIPNINLVEVNLSNNHIMGPIPHFFPSSQLSKIDFSNNLLSGPMFNNSSSKNGVVAVPLCQLENLEFLHLQRNQLSGTIPDCWGNSLDLMVIDLSSNKLSGSIPMTIGLLPSMEYLKLNNNLLEGTLPATLNQLSQLVILDLGENKLTGEVPNWDAKSHPFLQIFIMRANQLEGVIPSRLCLLPSLQFLDLAINNLTGSIPSCFGQLESMKSLHTDEMAFVPPTYEMAPATEPAPAPVEVLSMPPVSDIGENAMVVLKGEELQYTTTLKLVVNLDLSSNDLVGSIPEGLTNLFGLIGLNLSNNHLTGIIPQKIGDMGSLTSLDLSNNNLSGTIPSSLSALNFLTGFNLSSNMLHGEIPTGNQLQTLNDPSIYAHNAGLCGDPLPKCGGKHGRQQQQPEEEKEEIESTLEKVMFYIVVMLGFATGFWGVVGSLLYNRTWRHALFRRVEYVTDFLYVQVVVRIKRLKN